MVGVMQRFHEGGLYRAHTLRRTTNAQGRVVIEIASFNPPKRPRRLMVIWWEIDAVSIRFKDCATMQAARAEFSLA